MDEMHTVETEEQYWQRRQVELFEEFQRFYEIPEDELQRWEEYWDELARKGGEEAR